MVWDSSFDCVLYYGLVSLYIRLIYTASNYDKYSQVILYLSKGYSAQYSLQIWLSDTVRSDLQAFQIP